MSFLSRVRHRRPSQAGLSPVVAVANAGLSSICILAAAHQRMFADIAGYSAGVGVVAVVGVVAGGGSTISFVTGDQDVRQAVRSMRAWVLVPVLLLASVAAGVGYAHVSSLSFFPVALGGISVACNNLVQIEAAELQSEERIIHWATIIFLSRALTIALILSKIPFSAAMAVGALVTFALAHRSTRTARDKPERNPPSLRTLRLAYEPNLAAVSLIDALINRAPFLAAPLILSPTAAGAMAVLVSAQQSLGTVVTSGLYTSMTIRAKGRRSDEVKLRMRKLDRHLLRLTLLLVALSLLATPIAVRLLNLTSFRWSPWAWATLVAAIPMMALNRAYQYEMFVEHKPRAARDMLLIIALTGIVPLAAAVAWHAPLALAALTLCGEVVALGWRRIRLGAWLPTLSSVVSE